MPINRTLLALGFLLLASEAVPAQGTTRLDSATLSSFRFRSIGPANMGGRITDVEAIPGNSKVFYVATATGGIWKTLNAGTTFFPLFQNEKVISMGDIAIAPSNTNIIWAGTGEEDSRNSVSPGGGVYKSIDAGVTWQLMGLEKTQHIGRILIDPKDPNIVYVAAVGALWTANPDRGLYMTQDGGKTWTLSKFISDKAGFIDIAMDPKNSRVLYAASWERVRKPYALESGGPGSALWKSTNGGKSWSEISGNGFPATTKGRISLAIAPSDPRIIYAQVEADSIRGAKPQRLLNGTYRSADAGKTWTWMNMDNYRPFYFSQIRVDPRNPNRIYRLAQAFHFSDDGGASWRTGGLGLHEDTHAMWIDPDDPEHYILGGDAGLFHSWDRGGTYDVQNLMPLAQFYAASFDFAVPYRVCGGMQDNGTSCGPSRKRSGPILTTDWFALAAADGFYTAQDPSDPNVIYYETQGGNMSRRDLRTGETTNIKPRTLSIATYGRQIAQILASTDTTVTPAQQQQRIADVQRRMTEEMSNPNVALRWNWNTPFLISAHDPNVFYSGAEKVFRSRNMGTDPVAISPDLSARDPMHLRRSTGYDERGYPAADVSGGITNDVSWLAEQNTTVVTLAESPLRAGILFAGTGDGKVWLTKDDGGNWEDLTGRFSGVPPFTYVSRVETSNFDTATVYLTFDGHMEGDFKPYIFRSTDFGKTFQSIAGDLPVDGPAFVRVIREDPRNRNLLYVGTDVGLYFSLNGGVNWQQLKNNLPTVPVYDLKIHPRDRELVIASHGRGIWILDVNPLQQLTDSILRKPAHLFAPAPAFQYVQPPAESELRGNRGWRGDSGPYGAELTFFLAREITTPAVVLVSTVAGDTIARMTAMARPGINRVTWNFQQGTGGGAGGGRGAGGGGGGGGGRGGGGRGGAAADSIFPGVPVGINPRPAESSARPDSSRNPVVALRADSVGRGGRAGGAGGGGATDSTTFVDSTAAGRAGGRGGAGGAAGRAGGGGGGGAGAGRGGAGAGRAGGAGGGGGGGGGGAGRGGPANNAGPTGLAPTGDYVVTLIIDGLQYRQALRVEKIDNWVADLVVGAPSRRR